MSNISFADIPFSIAELRAEKEGNSSLLTPRDSLISMLRDIDQGNITVDQLYVCWRGPEDPETHLRERGYYRAGVGGWEGDLALLEATRMDLWEWARKEAGNRPHPSAG